MVEQPGVIAQFVVVKESRRKILGKMKSAERYQIGTKEPMALGCIENGNARTTHGTDKDCWYMGIPNEAKGGRATGTDGS